MESNVTLIRPLGIPRTGRRSGALTGNRILNGKARKRRPGVPERFPLTLDVRYTSRIPAAPAAGSGRTIDMCSSECRFTADRPLAAGLPLRLAIDWPVPFEEGVQLQLIAIGEVIWSRGTFTALKIYRHELRTRRTGLAVAVSDALFDETARRECPGREELF